MMAAVCAFAFVNQACGFDVTVALKGGGSLITERVTGSAGNP